MQSWQVLSFGLVIAVFVVSFVMRGKLRGKAAEMYGNAMTSLRADVANGRRPDEGEPICIVAIERKMLSSKLYYVAITNRRVIVKLAGGDTRSFDRSQVQLAIRAKTFADVGNMQTTYSRGWELAVALPDRTSYKWRVYDQAEGLPEHAQHVQALVGQLAA
ncbi:MAG TPA: hypothetical protein VFQ53_33800 [Kofleriaceae bacterium]|nr:hypothetical protein [Kofleriaceae bacterium]